jgi:hypothetical protein
VNVDGSHAAVDWCICDEKHGRINPGCSIDTHNPSLMAEKLAHMGRKSEAERVLLKADRKPAERCHAVQIPLMVAGMPIA